MEINIKGKQKLILSDFIEFYDYVINNIIFELKFDKDKKLERFYENNNYINGIKLFRLKIRSMYYNLTTLKIDYWLSRGWSYDESVNRIKEIQSIRSNISKEKMLTLKEIDYKKWCETRNTRKEFYMKKGLTEEESVDLLKDRQKTFSIESCIIKYGDNGYDVWKNRQIKWYSKIKNIDCDRDSNSSDFYKNKYGDNWIFKAIDDCSFLNKDLIKNIIQKTNNDFVFFIKELDERIEIVALNDIYFIFNSKLLQNYFGKNKEELTEIILGTLNINIKGFGNIRYFNRHICRSNGEYYIAKKLKELNIDYVYEKKYPNSKYVCDFYIPILNLYVEYMGMLKSNYIQENRLDIYLKYKTRYDDKEKFCKDNNIKYLFNNNMVEIIKKITNGN